MVIDCQKRWKVCNGNSFSSMGRGPPRVVLLGMYSPTPRPASCCLLAWHRHTTHSSERPGLANSKTSKDYIIPNKISKWHPILGPPCPGWSLNEIFYGKCLSETSSALPFITCGSLANFIWFCEAASQPQQHHFGRTMRRFWLRLLLLAKIIAAVATSMQPLWRPE